MKRLLTFLSFVVCVATATAYAQDLEIKKGDHICIVGNTLAERMQHDGWLEARLHSRFPDYELVFRNLGYSGDEIDGFRNGNHRMRSMSYGSMDEWLSGASPVPQSNKLSPRDQGKVRENRFELTNTKADIVFAFYGYNESWAGTEGLPAFRKNVADFINHVRSQKYNGKTAPTLVLFSPTAFEYIDSEVLPSKDFVQAANERLKAYSQAMGEVAKANNVQFVDLFTPTLEAFSSGKPHTINGVHLTSQGDMLVASIAEKGLFPNGPMIKRDGPALERLRAAVLDKNFYWYNRYRVTDGFSTYGDRAFLKFSEGPGGYGDGLSNYSVGQRELDVLDTLTANRDKVVWATAQGKDAKPDDSNLPEFIPVITNKPGPLEGGKHLFLSGEEAISKMTVHKNMKVELFADEKMFPELVKPVQMAFDTRGRLWVACWRTYPHWKPTEKMDDRLLILEDTDGDGRADKCTNFAGDLHNPTGFEFWNGGVLVAQGPDLLFLKDLDGDDKYDAKVRVVHGFDTADTHHTINSFVMDPGGSVYMQEGTFHHSQIETPWGPPRRVANGAVFRYEPRTQKIDVYVSFGFANPHGHIFDKWGRDIVWDGTGSQPYHALLFSGDTDYPHKHASPPQVYKQRTRPCSGTEVLSSSHFPEEFRGNILVNNVIGFQGILQYKPSDKDSSLAAVEVEPIVFSSDPNFRPGDVEVGPDGLIYFTDWQNPIIGHMQHNLRDPSRDHMHGRVYRVRYEGRDPLTPIAPSGMPVEKLLDLLKHVDNRTRHLARIELSSRPTTEVIAAAQKWLKGLDTGNPDYEHHVLEALWLHQAHNVVDESLLKKVLRSPEPKARAAATRVLTYWHDRVSEPLELFRTQVNDESANVRLQAIWGLSFFTGDDAAKASEVVVESLIHPQDVYLKHQLEETNKTLDRRVKAAKK